MKFAKELDDNAVPEWKEKYLDYKAGKKKLKAVSRAVRNIERTPTNKAKSQTPVGDSLRDAPVYSWLSGRRSHSSHDSNGAAKTSRSRSEAPGLARQQQQNEPENTPRAQPMPINERSPLRPSQGRRADGPGMTRYGSIIGSPPMEGELSRQTTRQKPASLLELPDPALDPEGHLPRSNTPDDIRKIQPPPGQMGHTGNAYEVAKPRDSQSNAATMPRYRSLMQAGRTNSLPGGDARPFMRRVFSMAAGPGQQTTENNDVALETYREIDFRQAEFYNFLDSQLNKIEDFYKTKEGEATERLKALREQLHVMRNRRLEEITAMSRGRNVNSSNGGLFAGGDAEDDGDGEDNHSSTGQEKRIRFANPSWLPKVDGAVKGIDQAIDRFKRGPIGKTSQAMSSLGTPVFVGDRTHPDNKDYSRRPPSKDVPYRVAKRKLKIALAEFYRGLELLKSYAILNRTAFRKINKKFDKTVNARPPGRYMAEKVGKAYFVNSEVLDGHIQAVEDLYARYFERGSHKIAVSKLRAKVNRAGDFTASIWRQGVLLATGSVFAIEGLVYGVELLENSNPVIRTQTSYLLQIYAGYFLMLLLSGIFVLDARAFTKARVNYQFIFEFDTRHMLDWRQLSEMPAFMCLLFGLTMWLNFHRFGGEEMFVFWPVVLIGLSVLAFIAPPPIFFPRARGWLLYSNWRLLLAGLYPVEFRDFFLGDMFCSLTYPLGNVELFFCLYDHHWWSAPFGGNHRDITQWQGTLDQCKSSQSHLLGFLTALPGIWRALQCIRRYYDTRNVFPHLVNCGKYGCTIMYYVSLSLYRMNHHSVHLRALFIVCAAINAIYCTVWDIIMDWSLGVPNAKHPFLRHTLAYKRVWWYYIAMVIDPIIRFNWIVYAIFTQDVQHANIASFLVAFTEVLRRGMWVLFRVENEHCTNVGRYRASRDVPLPYDVQDESTQSLADPASAGSADEEQGVNSTTRLDGAHEPQQAARPRFLSQQTSPALARDTTRVTGTDAEPGVVPMTPASASLRRRRQQEVVSGSPVGNALRRAASTMLRAHAQDYERKKLPEPGQNLESSDEDDDDDNSSDSDGLEQQRHQQQKKQKSPRQYHQQSSQVPGRSAAQRRRSHTGDGPAAGYVDPEMVEEDEDDETDRQETAAAESALERAGETYT